MSLKAFVSLSTALLILGATSCKPTDSKKDNKDGATVPTVDPNIPGGDGTAGTCVAFTEDVQPLF